MAITTLWKLPVPSTALLGDGPIFERNYGRVVRIRFAYEVDEGDCHEAIIFDGVEAYICTYFNARGTWTHDAYSRLIDRGETPWLSEIAANLTRYGDSAAGLLHLAINFDDGPCYEVICRSFVVKTGDESRDARRSALGS